MLRVLYVIDQALTSKSVDEAIVHIRIPDMDEYDHSSGIHWIDFILKHFGSQTKVLVLMPIHEFWLDIIIGDPTPMEMYCLRASLEAFPAASSVPYNIDAASRERIEMLMQKRP